MDDVPASRPPLWKRLLLAFFSLTVTVLVLEGATRLLVARPTPVHLRDHIYVSQLAKVNGRDTVLLAEGEPLPEKKRDGEIRIFVFGESSIQGAPFGYRGSPPTFLHDQLHAVAPDRDITVVNMGRGAGYMIDSYYFMVSIARFKPDYVVIYQGGNDAYRTDREMCLPASHPTLYAGWRFLVEHSRLLWTVRTRGPGLYIRMKTASKEPLYGEGPMLCDEDAAFRGWADILIETAARAGAKVVITTPVQNPLRWTEDGSVTGKLDRPLQLDRKDESYRRLLGCLLTAGCDVAATWKEEQARGLEALLRGLRCDLSPNCDFKQYCQTHRCFWQYKPDFWVHPRVRAVMESAAAHAGDHVHAFNLFDYLQDNAVGGLKPPLFVDEVHLSLDGYWFLAWIWTRAIGEELTGHPIAATPLPLDGQRYLDEVVRTNGNGGLGKNAGKACLLLPWAGLYLRANMPMISANLLRQALALEEPGIRAGLPPSRAAVEAQLLIGWLRTRLGLDSALAPALAARLPEVDIAQVTKELREHSDCSTVGGPLLPVVAGPASQSEATPTPTNNDVMEGESDLYAIRPGAEAAISAMLGEKPGGCALDGAQIEKSFIRATYRCAGGTMARVELHHPTERLASIGQTEKFSLVAGSPAPPPALAADLVTAIKRRESAFEWQKVKTGTGKILSSATQKRSRVGRYVLGALLLVGLGMSLARRRRTRKVA